MDEVFCTRTLQAAYARPVRRDLESYLLNSLRRVKGASQQGVAQVGANLALEACNAGSAGVSLLDPADPEAGFIWTALTGLVFEFTNGRSPRHDSACGDAVDTHQPLLFRLPSAPQSPEPRHSASAPLGVVGSVRACGLCSPLFA